MVYFNVMFLLFVSLALVSIVLLFISYRHSFCVKSSVSAEEKLFSEALSKYLNEEYGFISKVRLQDIVTPESFSNLWIFLFGGQFRNVEFDFVVYKKETLDVVCAFNIQQKTKILIQDDCREWAHNFLEKSGVKVVSVTGKNHYGFLDVVNLISMLVVNKSYLRSVSGRLTTSDLARKHGVTEKAMLQDLLEYGLVEDKSGVYRLTYLGEAMGGAEKISTHFGTCLLWPSHIYDALVTSLLVVD